MIPAGGAHGVDVAGQEEGALAQAREVERGDLELEGRRGAVGVCAQRARRARQQIAQLEPPEGDRQRLGVASDVGHDARRAQLEPPRAALQDELRR